MALIKCPECGNMISDKAASCIHCGFPIAQATNTSTTVANDKGTVIIYGLRQNFLIGGTVKIYVDGEYFDSVSKGASLEVNAKKGSVITAKCGLNPLKGKYTVKPGMQKIQLVYQRLTGSFTMQEIIN